LLQSDKTLVDRAAFLEQTARPIAIRNLREQDVIIRIMGDFAIIHAATSYTTADGQQATGRYTDCWSKKNGRWLAVSAHVSRELSRRHPRTVMPREGGASSTPRQQFVHSTPAAEYWIARSSRAMTPVSGRRQR
jgi:hypothetical protein